MQEDRSNWIRRIRADRKKEILEYDKMENGCVKMKRKTGEKWPEGESYMTALKNAYWRAGQNIKFFNSEPGSVKYVAIPLYASYIGFFTVVPLYPIFAS